MSSDILVNPKKHTIIESVLYHLAPGILIAAGYYLIVPFISKAGYPSVMALELTAIFILLPVELGTLFWWGKRINGKFSLKNVVLYRQKQPWWSVLIWSVVIFVASGLIMTLMNPINQSIEGWFDWIPASMRLAMGLTGGFARNKLILTYILNLIFIVFIAPTVEELYFRGFLLPRMPEKLGWAAPIFHSFLFAAYHLWSPWMIFARTLALLPLIYIVRWKKNLFTGMIAHWMINAIDFIVGVAYLFNLS